MPSTLITPTVATHGRSGRLVARRFFLVLAAVLFGLSIALALGELSLRILGSRLPFPLLPLTYDQRSLERISAGQAYLQFDPDLGWVPKPDAVERRRRRGGVYANLQHNHAGLRAAREYALTPPEGTRRIAAYGDSFVYCSEVNLSDCWTDSLERAQPRSEVLNFGVPGYAPDQAWLRYQRDGRAYRPCAVLIGHMVENINRIANRFRPFYYPEHELVFAKPRFLLDGDRLELLPSPARRPDDVKDPVWVETNLGPRDSYYFPGTFVSNPFDSLQLVRLARTALYRYGRDEDPWTPNWERKYVPGTEAFEVLAAVLAGFAEQVRADGATPVVLIFPWRGEIIAQRDGRPKPHAALLAALERRGVATIDLTDDLGREASRTDLSTLMETHYGALGNSVVTRALERRLPELTAQTCGVG